MGNRPNASMGGTSGRTADLTQVRSTPPTCKRTPHYKDDERGGRVRRPHTGLNQQCLLHSHRGGTYLQGKHQILP
ncbi:hypothetical protein B296_00043663 [Ensete ventricosum]|uniref:Uncharacterized protein n=1 Tax=Ensete ventricosum TaxID=4639 RepID=A0A426YU95_ENSVE|nr:hypothetical protein B296_00043663 [Ensete ventricosum]